jgi:5-hydroxyisourate hydrolase
MSGITTHVLDTSRGRPAAGVDIALEERQADGSFRRIASGTTDGDGRLRTLLPPGEPPPGSYRLTFDTGGWFRAQGLPAYFPVVSVSFEVAAGSGNHHVPLLLSPFGYSTYRGS